MAKVEGGKDLLTSKTMVGPLLMAIGLLLGTVGIDIGDTEVLTDEVVKITSAGFEVAGIFGTIYGRMKATKPITSVAGIKVNQ